MISFPNCKINLGLNILKKRSDGYHEVHTLMYPVPINDILEIIPLDETMDSKLTLSGDKIDGDLTSNLCWKAYLLLKERFKLPPVHIHLHKLIPMGGGLGGGSANGTYTLLLLNDLFSLNLSVHELHTYAATLGSDCAFFVENKPQFATGRGERVNVADLSLKGYYLLLVNDGTHVSTQMAYGNVTPKTPAQALDQCISQPIENWKSCLINDFETSVFKQFPHLNELKTEMYTKGAIYAAMTGSGSTVFGLFKEKPVLPKLNKNGFVRLVELS